MKEFLEAHFKASNEELVGMKNMKDMNMREECPSLFQLDQHRLDEEWLLQPRLYFDYALRLADAREAHEQAKSNRDLVSAELSKEIRKNPLMFGITGKATEASIEMNITSHERFQKANNRVIKRKHDMDVLQVVVDALDHRKKALENLVTLHGMSYFANPKAPKEIRQNVKEEEARRVFGSDRRKTLK